jgi:hypothetical protein
MPWVAAETPVASSTCAFSLAGQPKASNDRLDRAIDAAAD